MEPSTIKINLTFPFVVFGIYSKLRGVYLEVSVSVYNDVLSYLLYDRDNFSVMFVSMVYSVVFNDFEMGLSKKAITSFSLLTDLDQCPTNSIVKSHASVFSHLGYSREPYLGPLVVDTLTQIIMLCYVPTVV